MHLTPWNRY